MPTLEMIDLYPSPWSERLRWVLELKGLAYARRPFQPIASEAEHRRQTGIATAPVLLADGEIIGDSDAAVDWIEARHPAPALLPDAPASRAAARAWELAATEALAPLGRLVMIGEWKAAGLQPMADHFAGKYHWSPEEASRAERLLRSVLSDVARALEPSGYLVGDAFTRADLTLACMLTAVLGIPADDLFELDAGMRGMFATPLAAEPAYAPLGAWRDAIYRRHRGGRVTPQVS